MNTSNPHLKRKKEKVARKGIILSREVLSSLSPLLPKLLSQGLALCMVCFALCPFTDHNFTQWSRPHLYVYPVRGEPSLA